MVTRPTSTSLPGLELGSSSVGLVAVVDGVAAELGSSSVGRVAVAAGVAAGVDSSRLAPVPSLKIVVESCCGLYESNPRGCLFPVALS